MQNTVLKSLTNKEAALSPAPQELASSAPVSSPYWHVQPPCHMKRFLAWETCTSSSLQSLVTPYDTSHPVRDTGVALSERCKVVMHGSKGPNMEELNSSGIAADALYTNTSAHLPENKWQQAPLSNAQCTAESS